MPARKRVRLDAETIRNTRSDALLNASANGDVGTVGRLLRIRNVEVNAENKRTGTLLHVAAKKGHVEAVEVLLNRGADFNKASKLFRNSTPVHLAALEGRLEVLSVLLSRGASVDARNKLGRTPLHLTTNRNKPECARKLLGFHADVDASDVHNFSPLHLAARNGCLEICRLLLDAGADVGAASKCARVTPLHLAAAEGHVEVVKLFRNRKKSCLALGDRNQKNPLFYAVARNRTETAELLLSYQNLDINDYLAGESVSIPGDNFLHDKCRSGSVKTIEWLLSKGADVNAANRHGWTPLHLAARGHPRAVKVLLREGASVDAADKLAFTPLHFAAALGHAPVVKLLLGAGAPAAAADDSTHTPLHFAAGFGRTKVVKLLLAAGAPADEKDESKNAPLHIAAANGRTAVVEYLLSIGADVNAPNADHLTPLLFAHHPDSNRECKGVLQRHVVKMMALDLLVSESNSRAVGSDAGMVSFRLHCEEEIELMKSEEIANGVSFFDLLTKNTRQLITYGRNKDIVQVFKSNVYLSMFPIYAGKIKNRFVPAIERAKLLESSHQFFDIFILDHPRLDWFCIEKILVCLHNRDLKLLTDLAKSV